MVLIIILISLSVISIFIIGKNEYDNIQINSIQPVENELIPTYLGLFVIMLGLGSLSLVYQHAIVFMLFIIWWLVMEHSYYFNLIWLFRYRYYRVSDDKGNIYIIYSKRKDSKSPIQFNNLRRINNFTFFEGETAE